VTFVVTDPAVATTRAIRRGAIHRVAMARGMSTANRGAIVRRATTAGATRRAARIPAANSTDRQPARAQNRGPALMQCAATRAAAISRRVRTRRSAPINPRAAMGAATRAQRESAASAPAAAGGAAVAVAAGVTAVKT